MRNTFNIEFYCRNSKASKKTGMAHLEVCVTVNGKRLFMNTPYTCKPSDFAKKKKPTDLTQYMDAMKNRVNQILTDMLINQEAITSEKILSYLRNGGYKPYTVETLCDDYLNILKNRIGVDLTKGVYDKYRKVVDVIYINIDKNKEARTICNSDILTIKTYCDKTYQGSTAAGYMTKVKTIVKYGMANQKILSDPFNGVKIKKSVISVETITREELERIVNYRYNSERLQKVADLFVFSCGSGLAYADTQKLLPEDFIESNGRLCIKGNRQKTKRDFFSVLLPWAESIAKKYDYRLPKLSNQKLNTYLDEIADVCHITSVPSLHHHLARHFYATYLVNSGVPITTVAKTIGDTVTLTQHYAKTHQETIVKEVSSIL